ncbi:hypothetical protein [Achromobacter kerstersii]|uniref:hypothetical protein n=1 Tax=Achromobacter kerstersii TaxID=1353890 RepID=UPI0032095346
MFLTTPALSRCCFIWLLQNFPSFAARLGRGLSDQGIEHLRNKFLLALRELVDSFQLLSPLIKPNTPAQYNPTGVQANFQTFAKLRKLLPGIKRAFGKCIELNKSKLPYFVGLSVESTFAGRGRASTGDSFLIGSRLPVLLVEPVPLNIMGREFIETSDCELKLEAVGITMFGEVS